MVELEWAKCRVGMGKVRVKGGGSAGEVFGE